MWRVLPPSKKFQGWRILTSPSRFRGTWHTVRRCRACFGKSAGALQEMTLPKSKIRFVQAMWAGAMAANADECRILRTTPNANGRSLPRSTKPARSWRRPRKSVASVSSAETRSSRPRRIGRHTMTLPSRLTEVDRRQTSTARAKTSCSTSTPFAPSWPASRSMCARSNRHCRR